MKRRQNQLVKAEARSNDLRINDSGISIHDLMLPNSQASSDSFFDEILWMWRALVRYKKLIVAVFAIFFVLGAINTLLKKPVYTATSTLELNTSGSSAVEFKGIQSENLSDRRYLKTQSAILESGAVAEAVIQSLNLTQEDEFKGALRQISIRNGFKALIGFFSSDSDSNVANSSALMTRAKRIYRGKLSVKPINNSNLIRVSFSSFSPQLAAKIADEHVRAFVKLGSQRRMGSTSEAQSFIDRELENVQVKLRDSESRLTKFARENDVVDLEDNNIVLSRLSTLNTALAEVQTERINSETKYLQAKSLNPEGLGAVMKDELIKSLVAQRASLSSEYEELSELYREKYPVMLELSAKISKVDAEISEQQQRIVANLENDFRQISDRERRLSNQVKKVKNELFDLQDRAVTYNILKREWESNKALYSDLLERGKRVSAVAGMDLNIAAIVDSAAVPSKSSSSSWKMDMLLASGLGIFLGMGVALFLTLLDNRINDVRSLEAASKIPNIAVLPIIDEVSSEPSNSVDLHTLNAPNDIFSEAVNSLRSSLKYYLNSDEIAPKSFAITSSISGEGKSLISTNLAISHARSGSKTLLIEGDLRRPRIGKIFGVESSEGLTHCLSNGGSVKPAKFKEIPNLHVIFAGAISPNPVEQLSSKSMQALIAKCEEEYDMIIIDSPPVLGLADSIEISSLVDSVLMVVSAHNVRKSAVEHAIERLRVVGVPLVGTIFNRANPEISGYDYYAYGYYTDGSKQSTAA